MPLSKRNRRQQYEAVVQIRHILQSSEATCILIWKLIIRHNYEIANMQLINSIVALLGLTLSVSALDNGQACAKKNQGVVNAIGRFCQNKGIVVPSVSATRGANSPDSRSEITVSPLTLP